MRAPDRLASVGLGLGAAVYASAGLAAGLLALPYFVWVPAGVDGSQGLALIGLIVPVVWCLWGLVGGPVVAALFNVLCWLIGGVPIEADRTPVERS